MSKIKILKSKKPYNKVYLVFNPDESTLGIFTSMKLAKNAIKLRAGELNVNEQNFFIEVLNFNI